MSLKIIGASLFVIIGLFSFPLHAQDASTPDGQKAIEHRMRYYEGTPIKKISAKTSSFQLEGKKFSQASPAIYNGIAYTGTDSGEVVTITSSGMNRKYKLENAGAVEGAPAVTKDNVFVGFKNNLFAAFSREDGKLLWKYETKGPVTTTPLVHEKTVYFTTSNGYCYAINTETGRFKWRFNALSKASSPAYDNDVVFVGNDRQHLYAINAKNGDKIWEFNGAGGTPVINDADVFGIGLTAAVYSIDKTTGHGVWQFGGDIIETTTDIACGNNTLVFGKGLRVIGMDSRYGKGFKWVKDLSSEPETPIIVANVAYISCINGDIYAFDLETGKEQAHINIGIMPHSILSYDTQELLCSNGEHFLFIVTE